MLLRGGMPVLSATAVTQMSGEHLTPRQRGGILDRDRSWGFCQSVIVDGPRAGAFGWDGGLGSSWLVDPGRALIVIVLTQRMFEGALPLPRVHRDLQDAAYAAVAPD